MSELNRQKEICKRATEILKDFYGENAVFRQGQYEAIEATITKRRTLVVQRTGWGKSLVYFVCAKLFRERKQGVTMVISPLLTLMENQIAAAKKLSLACAVLNSTVRDQREEILDALEADRLDLLFVTPETLFSHDVQSRLPNIRIGLFVIDEAHCISDWGHDFRLEYGNLRKIVNSLPEYVPVLATTATANNRVITDLKEQLGGDVFVSKGPLTRDSLYIQVMKQPSKVSRYGWILEYVPKLPGSGIIYCLRRQDCDELAEFLCKHNIQAAAYYAHTDADGNARNREIEEKFRNNELKVLVATIKLGMGYDKGDIAFVIHYQMPANIVSYYQQIGRAGRSIEKAYIFLMCGKEDEDILNFFINTAFPTQQETETIVDYIRRHDSVTLDQMLSDLNIGRMRLNKALTFLMNDGFVRKEKASYYITPKEFVYDKIHYDGITAMRKLEMEQMKALAETRECYSKYIVSYLDDQTAGNCGHCANCLGRELVPSAVDLEYVLMAQDYLNHHVILIEPRKMWVNSSVTKRKKIAFVNQPGFCLSRYGDAGCGELVKRGKYSQEKRFCDELVNRSARALRPFVQEHQIRHLCFVPSLRSDLVKDFTQRLAKVLELDVIDALEKTQSKQQKEMENTAHQCANAYQSFVVKANVELPPNILLIDDMVDSGWTLTVCGYRLMEAGAEHVYPFALADSSSRED